MGLRGRGRPRHLLSSGQRGPETGTQLPCEAPLLPRAFRGPGPPNGQVQAWPCPGLRLPAMSVNTSTGWGHRLLIPASHVLCPNRRRDGSPPAGRCTQRSEGQRGQAVAQDHTVEGRWGRNPLWASGGSRRDIRWLALVWCSGAQGWATRDTGPGDIVPAQATGGTSAQQGAGPVLG